MNSKTPAADKARLFPILTKPNERSLFWCVGSQLTELRFDKMSTDLNGLLHWECTKCGLIGNTNDIVHKPRVVESPKPVELPPMPCMRCTITGDHVTLAPHPYRAEINDDFTPVWMCDTCRDESADDT